MKRSQLVLLALILGTLVVSGCYSHTYRTGQRPARAEADHYAWQHHVIYGLITLSPDIQLDNICPNGAAVIHNRMTVLNSLVSGLTWGIYTPTMVRIWCASGDAQASVHEIEIDITPELIEQARLIIPDFDEQVLTLHEEMTTTRMAATDASTGTF